MKTDRIRILFLIDELQVGGTERQLLFLAESLPLELFDPVIGVLRETPFSRSLSLRTPVVSFDWSGLPILKNLSLIGRIRAYLKAERFDVLQTHFVESEIYGFLAAHLCRAQPALVTTRRNLYHWIKDDPWRFRAGRLLVKSARAVLTNSHCARDACLRLEKVRPEGVLVIPNGVEVGPFLHADREKSRISCGLGRDDVVIGVVGNWRKVKGVDVFIKAASLVAKAVPAARMVLVGSGPQEQELRQLAAELGIAERVLFWGSSGDVSTLMSTFDVAVQPSRSESFSNVLVEYMAAALPVVATRVGDAEFIAAGGACARLVDPDDAEELAQEILFLCRNRAEALAMGERGRQRVLENWSSEKVVARYVDFYRQLVGEPHRA